MRRSRGEGEPRALVPQPKAVADVIDRAARESARMARC